jgi:hypothetical protein
MFTKIPAALVASLALALGAACNRDENPPVSTSGGVKVSEIDLGRSLNEDRTIDDDTTSFKPNDTVYASVATEGTAPDATLTARWTYQDGQTVDESSQPVPPTDDARTEFHVSKPDGWPTGKYKVDILLNGNPVGTKEFEVEQ